MSLSQAPRAEAATERTRSGLTRGRVTRSVAVVLAVGALVAATLGWRWWTHPDLLTPDNSGGTMTFGSRALAHSKATFGVTSPERGESGTTMTFRAAPSVDFALNTARAVVTVSICHPRPEVSDNTAIGSVKGSGSRYCGRIEPIRAGMRFTFRSADYIIATISPRTPGRVVITGMDFDYAMGRADWYRRGVDHLGMHIIMKRVT